RLAGNQGHHALLDSRSGRQLRWYYRLSGREIPLMYPRRGIRQRQGGPAFGEDDLATARRHRPDYWLVALCVLLLAVGLIVVYAISPALSVATHTSSSYYV